MIGSPQQQFEQWLRAPVSGVPVDPCFEVRRAHPTDFDAIYDLVDEAFGVQRPRAEYDWLYRANPHGLARCWVIAERETGRFVWAHAAWPRRTARGEMELIGAVSGDAVTTPRVQRQKVFEIARRSLHAHPWYPNEVVFGWPNARSLRRLRKLERTHHVAGPVPRSSLRLRARARLARRGWPRAAAGVVGAAVDAWRAAANRRASGDSEALRIEDVSRFDARFGAVSERCLRWKGFWFPRDDDFLNWRYSDHPTREYRSLAILREEAVVGYCVLGFEDRRATIMEFVAPDDPESVAPALLASAIEAAREADCDRVGTFACPGWRHWALLRAADFAERRSEYYVFLRYGLSEDPHLDDWQLHPGEHDGL